MRRRIRLLKEAVEGRRPMLKSKEMSGFGGRLLEELEDTTNGLLREHAKRSASEKSSLEQIDATLGSLREAVFIIDSDNYLLMTNDAFGRLLKSKAQTVGKRLESIIQGTDFFEYVQAIKNGTESDFFVLEVTIGSQVRWLEITGSRLPEGDRSGESMTLFVLHDITEQRRLERVRTEFVANLSHELRTPVTIIKGYADALFDDSEELDAEGRRHFLQKIQNSVSRLNIMLEELLLLSRLETNPNALQMEMLSLGKVVRDVTDSFRIRLAEKGRLEVFVSEGNDTLMIDPLRISQVMENLLENVLRHAKNFTQIEVRTRIEDDGVACAVVDDGQGIPERDLPHIFERFYRVDKGRSRESGGTGLGLSIVKHIIQQHGGEVTALSSASTGTVMGFKIPFPGKLAEKAVMSFVRTDRQTVDRKD
jgi:two-component system phosphate regulon sensor histidine kinase PhoR